MSEDVERRLVSVLNHPTTSPYGNPIPGLEKLGLDVPQESDAELIRLADIPAGSATPVVIRRLAEHVQVDTELIARLRHAGVVPNARITVQSYPGGVRITTPGHEGLDIPEEMAHAIQVEKV